MQIVTINIPDMFVDAIQRLTDGGMYPSRSEAIRAALRDFLKSELEMVNALLTMGEEQKSKQEETTIVSKPTKIDMRSIRAGWEKNKIRLP